MLLLTLSTAVLVLLVFVVLTAALALISHELREIGGTPTSVLAKLRLGLRAIERETSHLPLLNQQLSQLATGLKSVDAHLARTIDAAGRQGTR
jgi:hypothetical protein